MTKGIKSEEEEGRGGKVGSIAKLSVTLAFISVVLTLQSWESQNPER